jgi:hypothetical protein
LVIVRWRWPSLEAAMDDVRTMVGAENVRSMDPRPDA